MEKLASHFIHGWQGLFLQLIHPAWGNFFWLLVTISAAVHILEILFPWRKDQKILRPQLGLDMFYMFFNMFLFPLLGFATLSALLATLFESLPDIASVRGWISIHAFPDVIQTAILFVLRDFLQWNIHRMLHIVPFLWRLHEVHHSAEIMSYPVQLRYHWAENIVYRVPEYLMFFFIGANTKHVFWIYAISLFIGHLNHANFRIRWRFLKYLINTSELHIWHHARKTPRGYGVNFALTFSLWDWLFGTAYEPADGSTPEIGVADRKFPRTLWGQLIWPWGKEK